MTMAKCADVVIAIDGPSGVGKSTVAKRLAERLGYRYVDSGALYRAVGWAAQAAGVPLEAEALGDWIPRLALKLTFDNRHSEVWIDGQCVTPKLQGETVGAAASAVATVPAVRQVVTSLLRSVRDREGVAPEGVVPEGVVPEGVVMEGRDIGTVVFPDATVKFFLDASIETRGQRRFQDMQQMGQSVTLSSVLEAVATRDAQDRSRKVAPLVPSSDAHVIDATNLTIDDVVERMLSKTCL
jgi:cytidylate kinase